MAFSTAWLKAAGGFDRALGAGTRARGGDDLAAFFEVLRDGQRLVYEPAAVVRHRHARSDAALERTVFGYGVGLTAYLTRTIARHPRLALRVLRRAPAGLAHVQARDRRLGPAYPAHLRRREQLGMLFGPFAYIASRRSA
jgi:hypothetical protein